MVSNVFKAGGLLLGGIATLAAVHDIGYESGRERGHREAEITEIVRSGINNALAEDIQRLSDSKNTDATDNNEAMRDIHEYARRILRNNKPLKE